MKVLKFGGTSVGSAESIRNVRNIIAAQSGRKIVVVSAMSGVTNRLVEISEAVRTGNTNSIDQLMLELKLKHLQLIEELLESEKNKRATENLFLELFCGLEEAIKEQPFNEAAVITFGETFLSLIFSEYLEEKGTSNTLLDAKEFMQVSNVENPEISTVSKLLKAVLQREVTSEVYVTQGFVRIDRNKNISTLKRGGSDYTATIIGAAVNASEVQIWTDIDGFHNNDPRFVENTSALTQLTFEEAAELAYFGAKILHPQTVSPVKERNIPIFLKNTFTPEAIGTCISDRYHSKGLKAISAKDGITAIKIKSNRMLMAHGFLKKIFDVFDKHETAIDMITTSEIAISLTIDDTRNLDKILYELDEYGEITVDANHSIICVVGEGLIDDKDTCKLFTLLNDLPVRMISYGGSKNNISLLVDTKNKVQALQELHQKFFEPKILTET
ncbi:aspartate kinase [Salinimicrobium sediminis]|uniref:Aspartokinase n=1 Tax=Salinimicrobium sediminis TaxID=1343891 RepID=A0A285X4I7_9FLAO|nr:aspartate kinase [Salinimicrobium sediminis]SOC80232.1 aspartate kinase [Salinimicrobium sediminis]